jgi:hypothetical protein
MFDLAGDVKLFALFRQTRVGSISVEGAIDCTMNAEENSEAITVAERINAAETYMRLSFLLDVFGFSGIQPRECSSKFG